MSRRRGRGSLAHMHADRWLLATGLPGSPGRRPGAHTVTCRVDSEFEFTSSAWTPRPLVRSNTGCAVHPGPCLGRGRVDPKPVALAAWRSGVCVTWGAVRWRTEPSFASAREGPAPRSVSAVLGASPFSANGGGRSGTFQKRRRGPPTVAGGSVLSRPVGVGLLGANGGWLCRRLWENCTPAGYGCGMRCACSLPAVLGGTRGQGPRSAVTSQTSRAASHSHFVRLPGVKPLPSAVGANAAFQLRFGWVSRDAEKRGLGARGWCGPGAEKEQRGGRVREGSTWGWPPAGPGVGAGPVHFRRGGCPAA